MPRAIASFRAYLELRHHRLLRCSSKRRLQAILHPVYELAAGAGQQAEAFAVALRQEYSLVD
ncbi:hypothetical protein D3C71_2009700 [compost metagenome]